MADNFSEDTSKNIHFSAIYVPNLSNFCKIQKDYPSDSKSTTVNITSVNQITFDQSLYRLIYSPLVQDQHQSSNLGTFKPIFYPNGCISFQTWKKNMRKSITDKVQLSLKLWSFNLT